MDVCVFSIHTYTRGVYLTISSRNAHSKTNIEMQKASFEVVAPSSCKIHLYSPDIYAK